LMTHVTPEPTISIPTPSTIITPLQTGTELILKNVLGRGTIEQLGVSPDQTTIAVAGSQGVRIYDVTSLRLKTMIDVGAVHSVSWSADGSRLALGLHDGRIYVSPIPIVPDHLELLATLKGSVQRVTWSSDSEKTCACCAR
jgi:WD40 repeat protein